MNLRGLDKLLKLLGVSIWFDCSNRYLSSLQKYSTTPTMSVTWSLLPLRCVSCIYLGLGSMTFMSLYSLLSWCLCSSGLQLRNELSNGNVDESSMLLDSLPFRFALQLKNDAILRFSLGCWKRLEESSRMLSSQSFGKVSSLAVYLLLINGTHVDSTTWVWGKEVCQFLEVRCMLTTIFVVFQLMTCLVLCREESREGVRDCWT
jgi:hypothetical protein